MVDTVEDRVTDLAAYLDASPTPYHASREAARRLEAAGWRELREADGWTLERGDRRFVIRNEGSLIAFEVGREAPADVGFRVLGAHTDSPNLRLKPRPDVVRHGYRQLGVERYGGVLLSTWMDRDLGLAGRASVKRKNGLETVLVDIRRPVLRIPSLAIHLNREIHSSGLEVNAQQHLPPILGLESAASLAEVVSDEIEAAPSDIVGFDLMTVDLQPATVSGIDRGLLASGRLDNLASCHAALAALIATAGRGSPATRVIALHDHEEVGSESAQGAAGPFLRSVLERISETVDTTSPGSFARAIARSTHVSVDMAHAVHPNYADRHDPEHQPRIGAGPVIKSHAGQSYATDAVTAGLFSEACRAAGVEPQHFAMRSDLRCGSTIGPIAAARLGIRTVDVGNPMLAMHSARETAGTADVGPMIEALAAMLTA